MTAIPIHRAIEWTCDPDPKGPIAGMINGAPISLLLWVLILWSIGVL